MQKDKTSQGIVLDEQSQEKPTDKERAQTPHKSEPGKLRFAAKVDEACCSV